MTRTVFLLSLLLLCSGCLTDFGEGPESSPGRLADAEYAVLNTIVSSLVVHPSDSVIVLNDSTRPGIFSHDVGSGLNDLLLHLSQEVPSLEASTMQDFKAKNLSPSRIDAPARIHPKCIRASGTTRHFPWLEVGRVGFSLSGQQAIAYIGHADAPLSGLGIYYVLSRQSGSWVVIGSLAAWIS